MTKTHDPTTLQSMASAPHTHAWVSASAGSGKTKVLVQRILRLLLDRVHPHSILAITYTKAAAAEMKNRITKNLSEWAVCDEPQLRHVLNAVLGTSPNDTQIQVSRELFARVLDTPGGIKIQTIHSFFQSLLAQFPLESGVPIGFKVLEKPDDLIEKSKNILAQNPDYIPHLQHIMARGKLEDFYSLVQNDILPKKQHFKDILSGGIDGYMDTLYTQFGVCKTDTPDSLARIMEPCKSDKDIQKFLECIDPKTDTKTVAKFYNALTNFLESPLCADSITTLFDALPSIDENGFKVGNTKILKDNTHLLSGLIEKYTDYQSACSALEILQNTHHMMCVADGIIDTYDTLKRTYNVLDFDDIIYYTKTLLTKDSAISDWVAYKTDWGHEHILLDESQDTAPDQWDALRALIEPFFQMNTGKRTIFAVGDEKQSIYSFQGADPQGFMGNRAYFESMAREREHAFENVKFETSFRTSPAVLKWVDATMQSAKYTNTDGTPIVHTAHRNDAYGRVELLPPLKTKKGTTLSAPTVYAEEIACKIVDMIGNPDYYIASKKRLPTAGDILVLVPKRSGAFFNAFIKHLKHKGIPVAGSDRLQLSQDIAVQDIMALLQFITLPIDDVSLACVLKSPLVGLTDDDIFTFAHNRGSKSLWDALQKCDKYAPVVQYLNTLLALDYDRPFDVIQTILDTPCALDMGGQKPVTGRQAFEARLGTPVQDVLQELVLLSMRMETDTPPTIQGLLDILQNGALEIKREHDTTHHKDVRIMTTHGAKGLESPIVIAPDCYRNKAQYKGCIWTHNYDKVVWSDSKAHKDCILHILGDILDTHKEMAESKRLLYVTMTRAEDILICGGYGNTAKWSWYDALQDGIQSLENYTVDKTYQPYTYTDPKRYDVWHDKDGTLPPLLYYTYMYNADKISDGAHSETAHVSESLQPIIADWMGKPAHSESPMTKPLSPSRMWDVDLEPAPSPLQDVGGRHYVADIYKRGNIMHYALEAITHMDTATYTPYLQRYLATPGFALTPEQQEKYLSEILQVAHTHAFLFSKTAQAEVPISGVVDINGTEKPVNGIIDRLCIQGTTLWVVDFKSNRPPVMDVDAVPSTYKIQLYVYGKMIQQIYSDKEVKTAVLWTYNCTLLEIPFSDTV